MKVNKKILRYQGQDRCRCGGKIVKEVLMPIIPADGVTLHRCDKCHQFYRERGKGHE